MPITNSLLSRNLNVPLHHYACRAEGVGDIMKFLLWFFENRNVLEDVIDVMSDRMLGGEGDGTPYIENISIRNHMTNPHPYNEPTWEFLSNMTIPMLHKAMNAYNDSERANIHVMIDSLKPVDMFNGVRDGNILVSDGNDSCPLSVILKEKTQRDLENLKTYKMTYTRGGECIVRAESSERAVSMVKMRFGSDVVVSATKVP